MGALVGREGEMALLRDLLEQALEGHGRLALVSGDGGIGKSALSEALAAEARTAGALTVWGRCQEAEGAPAYWPWAQVLRAIPGGADLPNGGGTQAERFQFFEWATGLFKKASADRGLLVVLDDLHWADEPSLVFLRFLAGEMGDSRLMVVGNYRALELRPEDPLARALPDLVRERSTRQVALAGLTQPEVAKVIGLLMEQAPSADVAARVFQRTEGNPFFVIETARLLSTGADLQHLPEGVRQVIRRRTETLPPECIELLRVAAVIGREFDTGLLAEVSGREARDLLRVLDAAIEAKLIGEVADHVGGFRFNHALIRETFYEDLAPSKRVALHHHVGAALEGRAILEPDAHLSELANHLFRASPGGDALKAVDYSIRAAESSLGRGAFEEAARLFRMALEVLPRGLAGDRRRADLLLSLARALDLSDQQAAALDASIEAARIAARLGDAELAAQAALVSEGVFSLGSDASQMVSLCEQALSGLDDSQSELRSRLMAQLAVAVHFTDDPRRETLARKALDVAEMTGDPIALASALYAVQLIPWGVQDPRSRFRTGDRLLELGLETSNRKSELWGHFWRASALFEMGDMARLDAEIDRYGQVAEAIKDPSARWRTALFRGARAQMTGLFEEAEHHAAEVKASALPTQHRTVQVMQAALVAAVRRSQGLHKEVLDAMDGALKLGVNPTLRAIRACALAGLGRLDEAQVEFNRLVGEDVRTKARPHTWPITMVHLVETAVMLNELSQAELMYEMLMPYPERNAVASAGTAAGYGSIARYLGLLALKLGRADEAIAHSEKGIEMNRRQGALPYLALGECDLAEALVLRGLPADRSRALGLLAASKERAERLGMADLVARSNVALGRFGGSTGYAPLSKREVEVASLVAEGLTNRQISDRLHLSTRTAENHVENICNKLGFTSRAQIAAWAVDKGLVRIGRESQN
ncbi:MAG: ATP-binding protein [Candidatus Dormibacteraceae bacterium]